jgi:5-methyltetrahydropteroyltriglutamate--homocysteine methyltransferase
VRTLELWRIPEPFLKEAQDDATLLAIRAQEDAGLDIVTDGEIRRESYSNRFATALDGVDLDNPGVALDRSGNPNPVPRVIGPIRRRHPVMLADLEFLKRHTRKSVKVTVPGPFTIATAQTISTNGSLRWTTRRRSPRSGPVRRGRRRGADRRPYMRHGEEARASARGTQSRTRRRHRNHGSPHLLWLRDHSRRPSAYSFLPELAACACRQVSIETAQSNLECSVLRDLPGKKVILGIIDLANLEVETPEKVADRIRRALPYVNATDVIVAPDCGMKYLPRDVALGKLRAMVAGAAIVRAELNARTSGVTAHSNAQ